MWDPGMKAVGTGRRAGGDGAFAGERAPGWMGMCAGVGGPWSAMQQFLVLTRPEAVAVRWVCRGVQVRK